MLHQLNLELEKYSDGVPVIRPKLHAQVDYATPPNLMLQTQWQSKFSYEIVTTESGAHS